MRSTGIKSTKDSVLVIASTYPRWQSDPEPAFVHTLCKHLAADFDVHVLCPHSPGSQTREQLEDVTVHRFRYAPWNMEKLVSGGGIMANLRDTPWKWLLVPLFMASLILHLVWLTRRLKPGLIHAHWIIPQGVAIALASFFLKLPPVVITSHGGDLFTMTRGIMRRVKIRALRCAQHVTVVSQSMVDVVATLGVDKNRVSVAPMGVDLQTFPMQRDTPRIPGRILFVGRLVEKKGLTYLLSALPAVLQARPDAHLVIAGGGPEQVKLIAQAEELRIADKVTFTGPVPHDALASMYREATLFVAPFVTAQSGDVEGLGLVTLEAICSGCPVLVGDVPAVADVFPADLLARHVIDPGNVDALSTRILAMLTNPPEMSAVREYVINRFSWPACAARYKAIYRQLLEGRG